MYTLYIYICLCIYIYMHRPVGFSAEPPYGTRKPTTTGFTLMGSLQFSCFVDRRYTYIYIYIYISFAVTPLVLTPFVHNRGTESCAPSARQAVGDYCYHYYDYYCVHILFSNIISRIHIIIVSFINYMEHGVLSCAPSARQALGLVIIAIVIIC